MPEDPSSTTPPPAAEAEPETAPGGDEPTPRWVKTFVAVCLVVAVLFVVLKLAGGGGHGPGQHSRDASASGATKMHLS